jgi:predicted  nucleic acid-binding Zn-ribbon protein
MFKHHKYFPKERAAQLYLFPHVCFGCRKSFKKPVSLSIRHCPQCGGALVQLSRKFKVPKTRDLAQWTKVKFLVDHGFRFYSVYQRVESGGGIRVDYPRTLAEARAFVATYEPAGQQAERR